MIIILQYVLNPGQFSTSGAPKIFNLESTFNGKRNIQIKKEVVIIYLITMKQAQIKSTV